jgi:DNA-binding response OmpR family regulator
MPQTALRTVLIVDDEPNLRQLLSRQLRDAGYQLLEAAEGVEALEIAQRRKGTIDLLVTDIVMPRMDGFALASKVASQHPETRVLFITGHAGDHPDVKDTLRWTPHAFLLKPFTSAALTRKMEYLLLTRDGVDASQPSTAARFLRAIPVLYRPGAQTAWLRGLTVDVSDSGILLEAVSPLDVGSRLDLTLEVSEVTGSLPRGTVRRHGRVVRDGTPTASIPYPIGIQFLSS